MTKNKKIIELINNTITRENKFIADVKGSDNPQIIKMINYATGHVDALEAVRLALTAGDLSDLRIMAGEE